MNKKLFIGALLALGICCHTAVFAAPPAAIADLAERQIGVKRSEGSSATSPQKGFDCSGLTMYCYKQGAGRDIGRTCTIQKNQGRVVGRDALTRGDLVFFYSGWSHVGIYAGGGQVIHSSSSRKQVVKVPIWKDFVGGVKVFE